MSSEGGINGFVEGANVVVGVVTEATSVQDCSFGLNSRALHMAAHEGAWAVVTMSAHTD